MLSPACDSAPDSAPAATTPEPAPPQRDLFVSRARPGFLYLMYAVIAFALPVGLIGAVSPATAAAIATGVGGYLSALPQPLYALFGTAYIGYTAARQWGKAAGTDR